MVCNVEIKCDTNDKYGRQSFLISENNLIGESYNEFYKVQFPSFNKQYTDVPHIINHTEQKHMWSQHEMFSMHISRPNTACC